MAFDVFAGPIVRRAEPAQVVVWIAMLQVPAVRMCVYGANGNPLGEAQATAVQVGEVHFHVAVVKPSSGAFPRGQLLSYAITGTYTVESADYAEFLAWAKTAGICYGSEVRPGFVLQSEGAPLRFAAGSCRKFHDKGPDALAFVDDALAASWSKPEERYQALLLGGDQIYADDLDMESTFPAVVGLAKRLVPPETLPLSATDTSHYINRRLVVARAGFTTLECDGHLLSLGDFIALYGLAWNPDNWKGFAAKGEVANFVHTLPKVRRVLANVPTYMIFDDHDVTDDWFITNDSKRNVLARPQGKRIVANALAAYWLMQGWGNDPSKFDVPHIKSVIQTWTVLPNDANRAQAFDELFLNDSRKPDWEFATPTEPPCYALDTRTRRGGSGFPPVLRDAEGWRLSSISVRNKNFPFVLIAPAPLFTSSTIDFLQKVASTYDVAKYKNDLEGWTANAQSLILLFDKLVSLAISKVVVLSGDVHYYYSAPFDMMERDAFLGRGGRTIRGIQLTSSALKNGGMSGWQRPFVQGAPYYLFLRRDRPNCEVHLEHHVAVTKGRIIIPGRIGLAQLPESDYPDIVVRVRMNSLSPKSVSIDNAHNYLRASLLQNDLKYAFNSDPEHGYTF